MRFFSIFFLSCFLFYSCASPGAGPNGYLYSKVSLGIFATGENSTIQDKSCVRSILGLFAFGDASLEKIKKIHGIKEVTAVNWETQSFLGIYASLCVLVDGKK